jgi:hypothetical protein
MSELAQRRGGAARSGRVSISLRSQKQIAHAHARCWAAESTVVGTVAKGSKFRAIGHSEDGKCLKIETRDGLTGYCWAARARETR